MREFKKFAGKSQGWIDGIGLRRRLGGFGRLGRFEVGARCGESFELLIGNQVRNDVAVFCERNLEVDDGLRLFGGQGFQRSEDGRGFFGTARIHEGGEKTGVARAEVHPATGDGERTFVRRDGDEFLCGLQGCIHEAIENRPFPVEEFRRFIGHGNKLDDPFDPCLVHGGGVLRGGERLELGEQLGLVVGVGFEVDEESC